MIICDACVAVNGPNKDEAKWDYRLMSDEQKLEHKDNLCDWHKDLIEKAVLEFDVSNRVEFVPLQ